MRTISSVKTLGDFKGSLSPNSFQPDTNQESRKDWQSTRPIRQRVALMVVANEFKTATRVRREVRSLASKGYDFHVLCWDRQGRSPPREKMDHCVVRNVRLGKTASLPFSRLYYVVAAVLFQTIIFIWAMKQIAKLHAVILHAHDFNALLGCAAVKLVLRNRVRLVYDCHELTPGLFQEWFGPFISAIVGRLEGVAISQADAIISVNEAVHHHLKQQNLIRSEIIYNSPAMSEVPKIQPVDAKTKLGLSDRFVILFSGLVRQDYDFDIILQAARELKDSHLTGIIFVLVGPSEAMLPLIKTVTDVGVRSYFDFRGWVPEDELLIYYRASDLCYAVTRDLGPSTKILTPIKMFESMACGVPVIVRDRTLAAEIVRYWGCGIVINTGSSFAHELIRLKQSKEGLRTLGAAGLNAYHQAYSWNLMEAKLVQLYAELENSHLLSLEPRKLSSSTPVSQAMR